MGLAQGRREGLQFGNSVLGSCVHLEKQITHRSKKCKPLRRQSFLDPYGMLHVAHGRTLSAHLIDKNYNEDPQSGIPAISREMLTSLWHTR